MNSEMVESYRGGESAGSIARRLGRSKQTVLYHLRRSGVAIKSSVDTTRRLTDDQEHNICSLYISGFSMPKLKTLYGISLSTVSMALKRNGVVARSPLESIGFKPVLLPRPPDKYFYYWLGLMLSDGWVYSKPDNKSHVVGIGMNDLNVIAGIRDRISPGRSIYTHNGFNRLLIPICASDVSWLAEWSCTHRKSLTIAPTPNITNINDAEFKQLLVGLIEGDGSILIGSNKSTVLYSASKVFCKFVVERVGFGYIYTDNRPIADGWHAAYRCVWKGPRNIDLLRSLLGCEHLVLARKWDKAREFSK